MTGNKRNNHIKYQISKIKNKKGQGLLIMIMLLATVLTVVLSVSFKSTTETQVTKLEEESQKALAAAEAAIEASLKEQADVIFGSGDLMDYNDFSGGASISTNINREFVSPLIPKDEQFTFYLTGYDQKTKTFDTNYWSGNLDLYFKSTAGCPSLELMFINEAGSPVHYLIDPDECNNVDAVSEETPVTNSGSPYVFTDETAFGYKSTNPFSIKAADQYKVLIVRVIGAETKIGFKESSGKELKPQGIIIESTAQSNTSGVTKKINLFQSYPQIPAEFFVTSF